MLIGTKLSPNWHERQFSITFWGGGSGWYFPPASCQHVFTPRKMKMLRCSQKGDHFEKEISSSSHQFAGDMLVFREVTSKNMHRKSAPVSSSLFPICSLGKKDRKQKNYLNETEWNHLDFRKTPSEKKNDPPKKHKNHGMAAVFHQLNWLSFPYPWRGVISPQVTVLFKASPK